MIKQGMPGKKTLKSKKKGVISLVKKNTFERLNLNKTWRSTVK